MIGGIYYVKLAGIFSKTVDEALTEALIKLETTSDQIEYEVLEKESTGLLGLFSKPALIRVCKKEDVQGIVKDFLKRLFENMHLNVEVDMKYDEEEKVIYIDLKATKWVFCWKTWADFGFYSVSYFFGC